MLLTTCIKPDFDNLQQACSSPLASSLLKQFASSLPATTFIKSVRKNLHQVCSRQLGTSLLTTCNRLVVNKLSQAMRTHPDIGLLTTMLLQVVNKLFATCAFWAVYHKRCQTFD